MMATDSDNKKICKENKMTTAKTPNGVMVEISQGTDPTGYNRPYTTIKYLGIRVGGFADNDPTSLFNELKFADDMIQKTGLS